MRWPPRIVLRPGLTAREAALAVAMGLAAFDPPHVERRRMRGEPRSLHAWKLAYHV